jgi:hypothetical protein
MAGLVPAIPISEARPCQPKRDARHKAGHDGREIRIGSCATAKFTAS